MINIFGVIGRDVTFKQVFEQIQNDKSEELDVFIFSPGGSLMEGLAMYSALKEDPRRVKTTIMGQSASASTLPFMAGDERVMNDVDELMIHNVLVTQAGGNKYELEELANELDSEDQKLIEIYTAETGLTAEAVAEMMKAETKLNADKAIELGFATGKTETMALVALLQNNNQGETEMSEPKEIEKEKSFFAMCKDFFSNSSEEVSEPVAEDDSQIEAMEEDEDKKNPGTHEAENMEEDMEKEDEAKAESESLLAEKDAKIAELEEQLQNKLDKEIEAEKVDMIFSAMASSKLTHAQGKDMFAMGLEDVKAELESKAVNDTGLAKGKQPEAVQNYHEQYKAIKDNAERSAFYHKYKNEIKKDKNK